LFIAFGAAIYYYKHGTFMDITQNVTSLFSKYRRAPHTANNSSSSSSTTNSRIPYLRTNNNSFNDDLNNDPFN
jgi:hypothetical protein